MKKLLAVFLLPFLACAADTNPFAKVDEIVRELSEITGLASKRRVPHARMNRDQLKRYLESKIKEQIKPEEIRAEEAALKMFGFIPRDFDLEKSTVELLTEQAAAFYDYHRKRLYVIETDGDPMEEMALVHELAHALADQHFRLARYIKKAESADDESTARVAVMEGQATWITFEYMSRHRGRSLRDSPDLLKSMAGMMRASSGQFPVLDKTPLYLKETLLFPYTEGLVFQQKIIEKMGNQAFTEVFRRPPASTQQILHPEKYLAGERPTTPKLPEVPGQRKMRTLIDGVLGEIDHAILLKQYGKENDAAIAEKWRGSNFAIYEDKKREHKTLVYVSEWKDDAAARAYFAFYRRVLEAKWKKCEITKATASELTGNGDNGPFQVKLNGTIVTSVE